MTTGCCTSDTWVAALCVSDWEQVINFKKLIFKKLSEREREGERTLSGTFSEVCQCQRPLHGASGSMWRKRNDFGYKSPTQ